MRRAEVRTSPIVAPLLLSAALFLLYWVVELEPGIFFRHPDFRYVIFGPHLNGLLFVAWIPLIFVIVRLLDLLIFDVMIARRRNVKAPLLLRQMVGIAGYFLLFGWTISAIYHVNLGLALIEAGRVREAEPHLQPALENGRGAGFMANAYEFGAHLRRAQGRYQEAMDYTRKGIEEGPKSLFVIWQLKADLGRMLIECGDAESGIEALRE